MSNMKYLSLMVQELWSRFKVFFAIESQTNRVKDMTKNVTEFHSGA